MEPSILARWPRGLLVFIWFSSMYHWYYSGNSLGFQLGADYNESSGSSRHINGGGIYMGRGQAVSTTGPGISSLQVNHSGQTYACGSCPGGPYEMSNGIMSGTYYATAATKCGIFYTLGATVEKYIGSPN